MKKLSYQEVYRYFLWVEKDMGWDDVQKAEIYLTVKPMEAILHIDVDPNVPGAGHGCMLNIKVNGVTVADFGMFPNCDVWERDVAEHMVPGQNYITVSISKIAPLFWMPLGRITGYLDLTFPPTPPGPTPPPPVTPPPPIIITPPPTPTPTPFTMEALFPLIILLFLVAIIFSVFKK
ncbi:MAG: hypothetical protein QXT14_08075 [Candidatus Bathyarchaeia archaeon]